MFYMCNANRKAIDKRSLTFIASCWMIAKGGDCGAVRVEEGRENGGVRTAS